MSTNEQSQDPSAQVLEGGVLKFGARDTPASTRPTKAKGTGRLAILQMFFLCLTIGLLFQLIPTTIPGARVVGPVVMTFIYAVWGGLTQQHRQPWRDQFVDNCYFLGFIFTLLSLFVAFAPVALFGRQISAQFIIDQFGVGLGASVVGLLARTWFQNIQPDLAEAERSVEQQVFNLADTMASQFERVAGMLEALATSASGHVRRMQEFDASIVAEFDAATKNAQSLGAETERQSLAIAGAVQSFVEKLNALQVKFTETGDSTRGQIGSISQDLTKAVEGMTALVQAAGAMRSAGEAARSEFVSLNDKVSNLSTAFSSVGDKLGTVTQSLDGAPERMRAALDHAVVSMQESVQKLSLDASAATGTTIDASRKDLELVFEDAIEQLTKVTERFNANVDALSNAARSSRTAG